MNGTQHALCTPSGQPSNKIAGEFLRTAQPEIPETPKISA